MRHVIFTFAITVCLLPLFGQQPVQLSLVFSSEPQNAMAAKIPALLLEAYRQGHIAAYYPEKSDLRVPYAQFLKRYGDAANAQEVLKQNPDWFCEPAGMPKLNSASLSCLSIRFELGEKWVVNRVTMQNELQIDFIRLIHSETCDPRGFDTYGPMFKISDIEKLTQKHYRLVNTRNQAVTYSIIEALRLRLFNAIPRKE